ncbi:hypothetical protein ABZ806_17315 [Spirillospora sp. NPDC047418]
MNQLPYLAGLATRHAWAEREYARLHADLVEARLRARAHDVRRAARIRRWLLGGVPERIGGRRAARPAGPARPARPAAYCARAAARPAGAAATAGGAR